MGMDFATTLTLINDPSIAEILGLNVPGQVGMIQAPTSTKASQSVAPLSGGDQVILPGAARVISDASTDVTGASSSGMPFICGYFLC